MECSKCFRIFALVTKRQIENWKARGNLCPTCGHANWLTLRLGGYSFSVAA